MLIPSASILLTGALLTLVQAAINWYVWGVNLGSNSRLRQYAWPLTGLEFVNPGLSHLPAANQSIPSTAPFEPAQAKGAPMATDPDDVFKCVA
jgi:hypothetical protein